MTSAYTELATMLAAQNIVTVVCGNTCAYLGDERNLREFLVADELARTLRHAGHTVLFYLIDDTMDPLNFRQLRVALNKDAVLIEKYKDWCGKPIGYLPDPWGCCESYAAHFEEALLTRLHRLDCHPTLVRSAKLYERGVYKPYVEEVLRRYDEIVLFLHERFSTYTPEKLFWVLCPACCYIDQTHITEVGGGQVTFCCDRCEATMSRSFGDLQGKLNWKLDCAVRWAIFGVDAEVFSKAYLGSDTTTFAIAQAIGQEFFGTRPVMPVHYGQINLGPQLGLQILEALPVPMLRSMLVSSPATDLMITRDHIVTIASRFEVMPGLTYLDFVKQVLPIWLLSPTNLSTDQRELVAHGSAFKSLLLHEPPQVRFPQQESIEGEEPEVIAALQTLLNEIISLRKPDPTWEEYYPAAMAVIGGLGGQKGVVLRRLRRITGQQKGLPAARVLFLLPLDYLRTLEYMLRLYLSTLTPVLD